MARYHVLGTSALVLGIGLAGSALAQDRSGSQGEDQRGRDSQQQQQGQQQQQQGRGRECPACEKEAGSQGVSQQGKYEWSADLGRGTEGEDGAGQQGQQGQQGGASIPQFWIADAALFIGNAANTAQTLAMEQGLNVASPEVIGNHAQFLVTAVNRALSSLNELQKTAESSNRTAAPEIRNAIGHLVAAQAQAAQIADAANSGGLGPKFETAMRSTYNHLTAAERGMAQVGRAYGQPALAAVTTCPTRAFGAGLGAQKAQKRGDQAPSKGQDQQQKDQQQQQQQKDQQQKGVDQAPKDTP